MKVAVLFVCTNAQLQDTVSANRERLVPSALRTRWVGTSFSVTPLLLHAGASEAECLNAVENAAEGFAGVVVLAPDQIAARMQRCREALFIVAYANFGPPYNIQNQVTGLLQRALTNFGYLMHRARELKCLRALLLPLRDFSAPPIEDLRALFSEHTGGSRFARQLDAILRDLRSYQVPTRVAKDEVHPVYVDVDGKRFDRGREQHAEAETLVPPHDLICGLNKTFRFGVAYPARWHFNVTVGGDARRHDFAGCHELDGVGAPRASHANVFPNGYVC